MYFLIILLFTINNEFLKRILFHEFLKLSDSCLIYRRNYFEHECLEGSPDRRLREQCTKSRRITVTRSYVGGGSPRGSDESTRRRTCTRARYPERRNDNGSSVAGRRGDPYLRARDFNEPATAATAAVRHTER